MTKNELEEKVRAFAGENNSIDITAINGNLKICLTVDLWIDYISQILRIPETSKETSDN